MLITLHLLIDVADLLDGTEDKLNRTTTRGPDNLLNRSNHTNVWDILRGLEKILCEKE